jgi:hypothetical protein
MRAHRGGHPGLAPAALRATLVAAGLLVWALAGTSNATPVLLTTHPTVAPFMAIVAMARSGSTHLSLVLGQHPCIVNAGEFLGWQDPKQLHRQANWSRQAALSNPGGFLDAARAIACSGVPAQCGGQCTLLWKHFNVHLAGDWDLHRTVLTDPRVRVLVLERNVAAQFCSKQHAEATGDWGITPRKHQSYGYGKDEIDAKQQKCMQMVQDEHHVLHQRHKEFLQEHVRWFASVRAALALVGKPHVEVPFDASVRSCTFYSELLPLLMAHAGHRPDLATVNDADVAPCGGNVG